jgi:UPF0716 protein FxsA
MRIPFSFVFLAVVLAEISGFILVGRAIGVLPTLALVLLGMVAGSLLLRMHGIKTLMKVRADMEAGRTPARPLAEGAVLALAALLIILPGFLTDLVGALLFIPFVREALWRLFRSRVQVHSFGADGPADDRTAVVELERGEYARHPHPESPWRRNGGDEAKRPEA